VKKCVLSEDWQKYKSVKIKGSNLVKMVEAQMTVSSGIVQQHIYGQSLNEQK